MIFTQFVCLLRDDRVQISSSQPEPQGLWDIREDVVHTEGGQVSFSQPACPDHMLLGSQLVGTPGASQVVMLMRYIHGWLQMFFSGIYQLLSEDLHSWTNFMYIVHRSWSQSKNFLFFNPNKLVCFAYVNTAKKNCSDRNYYFTDSMAEISEENDQVLHHPCCRTVLHCPSWFLYCNGVHMETELHQPGIFQITWQSCRVESHFIPLCLTQGHKTLSCSRGTVLVTNDCKPLRIRASLLFALLL